MNETTDPWHDIKVAKVAADVVGSREDRTNGIVCSWIFFWTHDPQKRDLLQCSVSVLTMQTHRPQRVIQQLPSFSYKYWLVVFKSIWIGQVTETTQAVSFGWKKKIDSQPQQTRPISTASYESSSRKPSNKELLPELGLWLLQWSLSLFYFS